MGVKKAISIIKQLLFAKRVFFRRMTFKNIKKTIVFIYRRYIKGEDLPFSVVMAITYQCQCGCVHCSVADMGLNSGDKEMSTQDFKKLIDDIDEWGPLKITFFGGEPLLRRDLAELVAYASSKGIRPSIDSNGLAFNEPRLKELIKAGVSNINVSLDSPDSKVHDEYRKVPGCFDAAIRALRLCVKYGVPCLIGTYAKNSSRHSRDLEGIIAIAKREKVNGVKILFPILSGKWRTKDAELLDNEGRIYVRALLDPSYVYVEDAIEMEGKKCSAIEKNLIYVSPYGDIQPCPAIPVSFGNLLNEPMLKIVKRMMSHPFYTKHSDCSRCLMNDKKFREQYFTAGGGNAIEAVDSRAPSKVVEKPKNERRPLVNADQFA